MVGGNDWLLLLRDVLSAGSMPGTEAASEKFQSQGSPARAKSPEDLKLLYDISEQYEPDKRTNSLD